MNIKENWQMWLKIIGVMAVVIAWALTTQAKVDQHIADQNDTVKLLLLICKNTAESKDVGDCYNALRSH